MNLEQFYNLCLAKKGTIESFPFDGDVLVFKIGAKIFASTSIKSWETGEPNINLKCYPQRSIELRAEYEDIIKTYHMSKVHWNTVYIIKALMIKLLNGF